MAIQINTSGSSIGVKTPHADLNFNRKAKELGGSWAPAVREWRFDVRNEALVRAALKRSYGTDGTTEADVVSVQMHVDKSEWQGPVSVAGRLIARAFGRDSGATLADGVVLLSGKVTSGGSRANWRTVVDGVVLLHDVPRKVAEKLIDGKYTGVSDASIFDPTAAVEDDDEED